MVPRAAYTILFPARAGTDGAGTFSFIGPFVAAGVLEPDADGPRVIDACGRTGAIWACGPGTSTGITASTRA